MASDVSIGKFDILATYAYAKAFEDGLNDDDTKQRGMVAAIMGAQARLGVRKHHDDFQARKDAAERKKKATITAASFDHQVRDKLGDFFEATFLPAIQEFVAWGALLRRGEGARQDSTHVGGEDQRCNV